MRTLPTSESHAPGPDGVSAPVCSCWLEVDECELEALARGVATERVRAAASNVLTVIATGLPGERLMIEASLADNQERKVG